MKFVISQFYLPWQHLGHCFSRAVNELGLDGVEVSLHPSFRRDHLTRDDVAAAPAAAAQARATVTAHLWGNLGTAEPADAAADLQSWLEPMQQMGIAQSVIHGGRHEDARMGLDRVIETLKRVADPFAAHGVQLNIENHYAHDYRDCQELLYLAEEYDRLLSEVDHPAIGCCFDTGHAHMTGNWRTLLAAMAPRLTYLHIADNHGEHDDHLPFGRGTVPFAEMLPAIAETGFDGPVCFETPTDFEPEALARGLVAIKRCLGG